MNHLTMTLPFILLSLVVIVLLAHSDPRRRQLFNKTDGENRAKIAIGPLGRKLLAWSLLLPFIPLFVMANYAGILMYAGALTTIGWIVSELPPSVV